MRGNVAHDDGFAIICRNIARQTATHRVSARIVLRLLRRKSAGVDAMSMFFPFT
jgi:hypothetical protein